MSIHNETFEQYRADQKKIEEAKSFLKDKGYIVNHSDLSNDLKTIIDSVNKGEKAAQRAISEISMILGQKKK